MVDHMDSIPSYHTHKERQLVQVDWNAKVGEAAQEDWEEVCGPFYYLETNDTKIWDRIVSVPDHCLSFYFATVPELQNHLQEDSSYKQRR